MGNPTGVKGLIRVKPGHKCFSGDMFTLDNNIDVPFLRNPMGRTGMIGRGLLGRWGPNHAADPVVTRYFQMLQPISKDKLSSCR